MLATSDSGRSFADETSILARDTLDAVPDSRGVRRVEIDETLDLVDGVVYRLEVEASASGSPLEATWTVRCSSLAPAN